MTPYELRALTYFTEGERDAQGVPIAWDTAHYPTFFWLDTLRQRLDAPIRILRATHPGKPTAVDWTCPSLPFGAVVMTTLRLPTASYGFYSGGSVHVDLRAYDPLPARWLAIRPTERAELVAAGLTGAVTNEANGWQYLHWSWSALQLVVRLAERKQATWTSDTTSI